jgi:hypothetical protein
MAFDNLPPSKPAPRRTKTDPIFCVGWRAFVHWPTHGSQTPAPVPLMNAADQPLANNLVDGQAVEILSWRPRSREGLMYQIRSLADGSEWWIAAHNLRRKPLEEKAGDAATSAGRR